MNPRCPVVQDAEEVLRRTKDLVKSFRLLRRSLNKCHDCEQNDGCLAMVEISNSINGALEELNIEWGISSE